MGCAIGLSQPPSQELWQSWPNLRFDWSARVRATFSRFGTDSHTRVSPAPSDSVHHCALFYVSVQSDCLLVDPTIPLHVLLLLSRSLTALTRESEHNQGSMPSHQDM